MAHRAKSTRLVVMLALAGVGVTLVLARGPATPPAGGEMTPAAGTSAKVGPSGVPVPGRVRGWTRVFADGFDTRVARGHWPGAVRRKWGRWSYPNGWKDTHGIGTYYPSRVVSQHNSLLDLYIHTEHGVHMVAAPVPTIPHAPGRRGGLRYGRYAVRFKADPLRCYKTAWLLWPDSGVWPRDGEIDFPEGDLNGHISGFVHHKGASSSSDQDAFNWNARYTSWHTAILAWRPNRVNMYLDGVKRSTSRRVPSKPMHWVLQTEANCNPQPATAGHVLIDWVAVWRPSQRR